MLTYNHEDFILEAINGIVIQKTDFEVELIIADDNSPDETEKIVLDYLNNTKLPGNITINYTKHKSNKGANDNYIWAAQQSNAKYIANCEGDDYWTDPLKLQKQVDFLEANPEYSLVCGGYKLLNTETGKEELLIKDVDQTPDNSTKGFDVTIERFLKQWLTKTMTLTFRKEFLDFSQSNNYRYFRDVHLIYHLLKAGRGYYMKEVFGIYRIHEGGVFSAMDAKNKLMLFYLVYNELSQKNKNDIYLRRKLNSYLKKNITNRNYQVFTELNKYKMLLQLLINSESKKQLKSNLKLSIKHTLIK
jgi:glycosyltransferase involved in cell wall biosynthesis